MSRRKAFYAGDGAFLIADEFAEEVYIGVATIPQETKGSEMKIRRRTNLGEFLDRLIAVFAMSALIVGFVVARCWR